MALYSFVVDNTAEGQRMDALIRRFLPELSAIAVREAFLRRDVKLDGKRVPPQTRAQTGSLVQVYTMEQARDILNVVYEDSDVLLVNKPAGISVQKDSRGGLSLEELALRHVRLANPGAAAPEPCHRLDNQTCGLVLFACSPHASSVLRNAFKNRTVDKRYVCLVRGQPKPASAVCRAWLKKDPEAARVLIADHEIPGSRPIITEYETLEPGSISRLQVHLITGRTHQIRAHMAALGHPLLGDDVYGDRALNRRESAQGKLMLCASSLTLLTRGELPSIEGRKFEISPPF